MKRLFQNFFMSFGLVLTLGMVPAVVLAAPPPAPTPSSSCSGNLTLANGVGCGAPTGSKGTSLSSPSGIFKAIANTLLILLGIASVIMVIIGGFKYVLSNGNSSAVNSAKDTVLYAIIGLIVALLAGAIVNFVVRKF